MKIESSSEESILNIFQALRMFGLNLTFIHHIIKILRRKNSSFYSLNDFSKKHPEFYSSLNTKIKEKMVKIEKESLDSYNNYKEEIEFIRLSSGRKQLKNIIKILINSDTLNIALLQSIISLFESTVISNGSYKTSTNNMSIHQIKVNTLSSEREKEHPYEIIYFDITMKAEKGSAFIFFEKSNTKINYKLKIKSFNSIEEIIAWI